ncbi:protein timeless homolog [Sesamum indicum]|uniref:Protein timeless homolog n=1 Tax=Sesamum indicum TaxID=4182 RepID=A0A6I9SYM6_SESIN|nr:protein timeless homolog [Sesamum indicum]
MDGLSSICAGLGTLEEDDNGKRIGYAKGEYCSDNLKDLLRFLRRDDPEKRDVFKQVCKWNIVGKDLIPIIEYCQEDRNLVLNSVKVLVFLTMPVEPTSIDIAQQIEYLWGLKSAITFSDIVPVIVSLLESPLENLENESFTEEDWKLVQLVLTLFRNLLAIQDISTQQKAGGSATQFLALRDRFLELLFQENVTDLILVLSQHTGGSHGYLRQDNLLLLEVFYYIFKGQEPELIAKAYLKGSKVEDDPEETVSTLQSIMTEEQEKRKLTRFHKLSCYSQFSGTFTRVSLDGSKALLKGNPSASADALLKAHKNYRGPSKREMWDHGELPSIKNQILQLLDDFISQFLMGGYNVLMLSIREDIEKENQEIQSSDVVMFFQVAQFVTSFQYHKCLASKPSNHVENRASATCHDDNTLFTGSICGPIAETLNESMFLMVISKWRYAFEGLKQTNDYKFLSAAGSLVKIMIRMLDLVLKQCPEDSKEPQTARVLLYKLFYDQTEEGMTQFLLNLIRSFDTHKQSKSDLANLVESMHVVLRLLENLQARGTLRVSKKSRKKRMNKSKNENVCEPSVDNATVPNEVGSSICEESADINLIEKETLKVQDFDVEADRSMRDSIQVDEPAIKPANLASNESETDDINVFHRGGLYPETDNSSGDEQLVLTDEVDFKVSSLVYALANNSVIQKLCWLLKFYKSNSVITNHYIVSMLRRICDDLELSPMLYQLSYLTIFYEILEEQKSRPCKEYENVVTFLTSLVRRMLRKMKSYPLLFVEVLFWKTRKECHYINCGSMLNELNSMKNKTGQSRSDTKSGGNGLFEEQQWVRRSIADALGDDDFVAARQDSQGGYDPFEGKSQKLAQSHGEQNETSTSNPNKAIDGSEISDREGRSEEPDRISKRGSRLVLSDEMEGRLKDLYEKYKDNPDCCQLIAGELDPNGDISKMRVAKTLKQLGFKMPAREKMQRSDASIQLGTNKRDLTRGSITAEESSPLRKPTHSRKRVHAFSVDEEQKIKDLFEQFKDQKRCSYMIANALDGSGRISAARVSRKLKQLGLVGPRKKRSHANKHLKDEDFSDISSEAAGKSDDETLFSRRNRGKQKRNEGHYDEEHSMKIAQKLPEDVSDDELLSSMFVKRKKRSSRNDDDEHMNGSFEKNLVEANSIDRDTQVPERDASGLTNQIGAVEDTVIVDHPGDAETEAIVVDNPNESDAKSFAKADDSSKQTLFDDELDDELVDFDKNTDSVTTQENSASRRRLRMVIDYEDDDE